MTTNVELLVGEPDFGFYDPTDVKELQVNRNKKIKLDIAGVKLEVKDFYNPDSGWVSASHVRVEVDSAAGQKLTLEGKGIDSVVTRITKSGKMITMAEIKKNGEVMVGIEGRSRGKTGAVNITNSE